MAGLLARGNLRAEDSRNPVLNGEQQDHGKPGPSPEGGQGWGPFLAGGGAGLGAELADWGCRSPGSLEVPAPISAGSADRTPLWLRLEAAGVEQGAESAFLRPSDFRLPGLPRWH